MNRPKILQVYIMRDFHWGDCFCCLSLQVWVSRWNCSCSPARSGVCSEDLEPVLVGREMGCYRNAVHVETIRLQYLSVLKVRRAEPAGQSLPPPNRLLLLEIGVEPGGEPFHLGQA